MTLPGGFSPMNAVKQIGSVVNPTGGVTNYDVFGSLGNQRSTDPQVQGASTDIGYMYYDTNQGKIVSSDPQNNPTTNSNPTFSQFDSNGNRITSTTAAQRAAAEKAANDAALRAGYSTTQGNYQSGAQTQLTDVNNEYGTKTRNFLNTIGDQQSDINQGTAQNQLNLRQSMSNIVKGIQQGVRSGGVALAGMNASDSSASDAMARAYAESGNRQTGEARGIAADEFAELQKQQGLLNRTKNEGLADQDTWKTTEVNRVKADLSGKLQALTAEAQGKGINGVVDMGIVDRVVNEAIGELAKIDQTRTERLGGIKQWTPDQAIKEALRMEQAGAVGNAFSVEGPEVNYQGNGANLKGAPVNQLPIYVKGKDQLQVVPGKDEDKKIK